MDNKEIIETAFKKLYISYSFLKEENYRRSMVCYTYYYEYLTGKDAALLYEMVKDFFTFYIIGKKIHFHEKVKTIKTYDEFDIIGDSPLS